ncbi:hypothetical protein PPL_06350 [Heterostelium album PN500]|uniref:Pseudouridine synthase I TruA alpha/beta domain-containing protein n=1 Tax=Heterostelium pallidum (strain ATCC 26659 / Pp 5 / PN500) TaxID=670386 RepID=D3BCX2_HETP5|nr:hypothetical protein PPL_06350 [Heterostelium album PN500]EFA80764.1 hypothetical protein PPL_06350 [Heterostelium album PN500]|eukprot:XP_020432883.1 hypothetical protein PPL_06350 [Heterostelium album PN500]
MLTNNICKYTLSISNRFKIRNNIQIYNNFIGGNNNSSFNNNNNHININKNLRTMTTINNNSNTIKTIEEGSDVSNLISDNFFIADDDDSVAASGSGNNNSNESDGGFDIFRNRSNREEIEKLKKQERFHATPAGAPRAPQSKIRSEKDKTSHEMKMAHFAKIQQFFDENKHLVDIDRMATLKKSPMALLFAYVGTGYHGLEYQISGYNALENTLEQALFKAGLILPSNLGDLDRIRWSRSSRTDKGVHSLSTLLAGCLEIEDGSGYYPEKVAVLIEKINRGLPPNLRILALAPTSRSFDPRRQCTSRTYHYVLPKKYLGTKLTLEQINESILPLYIGSNSYHNFTSHRRTYKDLNEDKKKKRGAHRNKEEEEEEDDDADEEEEEEVVETKEENSNNKKSDVKDQTWKETPVDRDAEMLAYRVNSTNVRRINSFKVVETSFKTKNVDGGGGGDEEWVRFEVEGASFIQYQIRKMIGFVLAIGNGYCDRRMLELALKSPFSIRSPVAPPNPLYLFDFSLKERTSLLPLNLFNQEQVRPLKEQFCQNTLYPHLAEINETDHFFNKFMQELLPNHFYSPEKENVEQFEQLYSKYLRFIEEQAERKKQQQQRREQKEKERQQQSRSDNN